MCVDPRQPLDVSTAGLAGPPVAPRFGRSRRAAGPVPDVRRGGSLPAGPVAPVAPAVSLADLVGRTPLIQLRSFERPGVEIHAKAEWANATGSVKARAALRMILDGERSGRLTRDRTILDATSGNTGIALAALGAARGYRVRLCMPGNVTVERRRMLAALGADLITTDPLEGSDGAIVEARRIAACEPSSYFYADQYNNPANWLAHYETTGAEIIEQTQGRVTHFVAGLGTSGTFVGTGRRLRSFSRAIRLVSMQPDAPLHGIEGLKHMATAIVPGIYDPALADAAVAVGTEEAQGMVRRLARQEGLLVGVSSGAALVAALRVARELSEGVIVTVFPDGGDRYLSEAFWSADGDEGDEGR